MWQSDVDDKGVVDGKLERTINESLCSFSNRYRAAFWYKETLKKDETMGVPVRGR